MCTCAAVPFWHPVQSVATRIRSSSMPDITVVSRGKRLLSSHGDDVLQPDLKKYSLVQQYNQKSAYQSIKADFLFPDLQKGKTDFLKNVSRAVSKNRGHSVTLGKYSIKIGPFEDTPYKGRRDMFDEWEQFYLRDHMFMEVIGVAKTLPKTELVLMVCGNGKVYGYEDNHLHLVSGSLKVLFERGVKFPGTRQYYLGQSFKDMTEDQCKKAKESDKVREMMEKHKNMLKKMKPSYLQSLKIIQQYKQQMPAGAAAALQDPLPVK